MRQKVLAACDLGVDLGFHGRRREHRVFLPFADFRRFLPFDVLFLELGKEPVPGLVRQSRVFRQFPLDHQLLDVVNGVHVFHAILNDLPHRFQTLPPTHAAHGVALHQDVAPSEHLNRFQGTAVRAHQPLPAFHVPLLVPHQAADFHHVALHVVLQDLKRLRRRHRSGQEFDQITSLDDDVRVERLPRRPDRHAALD